MTPASLCPHCTMLALRSRPGIYACGSGWQEEHFVQSGACQQIELLRLTLRRCVQTMEQMAQVLSASSYDVSELRAMCHEANITLNMNERHHD